MLPVLLTLACSSAPAAPAAPAASASPAPSAAGNNRPVDRFVVVHTADGERRANVHHPASAGPGAPLLVVLHPVAVNADAMEANFGWDAVADREGLVVAYPDGVLDGFQDTWNAGRCCPPASELHADDVGFLDLLVSGLRRFDQVGRDVRAVGFSNGAMLAYDWACSRPGALVAIGVVAGALMTDCPSPTPLTVVAVHGSADPEVPLMGGPGPYGTAFPPLDDALAPFRRAADCPADPKTTAVASGQISVWSCAGGVQIVRAVVDGLGHAWPGAGPAAGTTDRLQDATGFLWARLRATS